MMKTRTGKQALRSFIQLQATTKDQSKKPLRDCRLKERKKVQNTKLYRSILIAMLTISMLTGCQQPVSSEIATQ